MSLARRIVPGALVVAVAVLLGGCGGGSSDETSPSPVAADDTTTTTGEATEALDGCATEQDGTIVAIPAGEGETLDGIVVGEGHVGVVLAHQNPGNLCSWLPFARRLAEKGHAALAFDFEPYLDPGESVVAAAEELRRRGAQEIVLVGASMGGTAALVAARSLPSTAGVVSVSGPEAFRGLDAGAAVRGLDVPLLLIVARGDDEFVPDARRLFRSTRSADKRLVVLPGSGHGTDFFGEPVGGRAPGLVEAFVAARGR